MKPAAFEYVRAHSIAEAVQLLGSLAPGARLIAGGQSLVPALNLRLNIPTHLIDIGNVAELRGIAVTASGMRIGAGTRQSELQRSGLIAQHAPLIAEAIPHIAHTAIRNRGTIGGNLAHADPASELPACMVALDATIIARGPGGERSIAAVEFFTGVHTTALKPDEILTAVEIPSRPGSEKSHFAELSRRKGDYAMAGLACVARLKGGALQDIRPVFFGVAGQPVLAKEAKALILGRRFSNDAAALRDALAKDLAPQNDLQASAATRLHLAAVLLQRCVASFLTEKRAA
jgi:aerobic carbon-monoxide dehydrogenase medium subunit